MVAGHVLATRLRSSSQNAAGSKPATSRCSSASVALSARLLPCAPARQGRWAGSGSGSRPRQAARVRARVQGLRARASAGARAWVEARARGSVGRRGKAAAASPNPNATHPNPIPNATEVLEMGAP